MVASRDKAPATVEPQRLSLARPDLVQQHVEVRARLMTFSRTAVAVA